MVASLLVLRCWVGPAGVMPCGTSKKVDVGPLLAGKGELQSLGFISETPWIKLLPEYPKRAGARERQQDFGRSCGVVRGYNNT